MTNYTPLQVRYRVTWHHGTRSHVHRECVRSYQRATWIAAQGMGWADAATIERVELPATVTV